MVFHKQFYCFTLPAAESKTSDKGASTLTIAPTKNPRHSGNQGLMEHIMAQLPAPSQNKMGLIILLVRSWNSLRPLLNPMQPFPGFRVGAGSRQFQHVEFLRLAGAWRFFHSSGVSVVSASLHHSDISKSANPHRRDAPVIFPAARVLACRGPRLAARGSHSCQRARVPSAAFPLGWQYPNDFPQNLTTFGD